MRFQAELNIKSMPKQISFTNYARKRGLTKQKAPFSLKTPTGKLASEYFELLKLTAESPLTGTQAFLGKVEQLKQLIK